MKHDSLFGAPPKGLKRLAALGLEGSGHDHPPEATEPLASGPFLEKTGDWIGSYRLLSVLGEGGMGIVYLAEQRRPIRRQVALKLVKPGMDSQKIIARFEAEQQALAVMDHPHVAHVYDAGLTGAGRPYFVMEYVEGIPITEHSDRHTLTVEQRLELFLLVCAAVQHAHHKGIIHRDLKPSNILVSIRDGHAAPKVIDFGIAKALSQPLTERTLYTEQGQFVGTPEYMSPEQAESTAQGIDTRTDVYSLGVVLYELLAGVLPFDADALREGGPEHIRRMIREQDPKTPSTRLSTVAGEASSKVAALRRTDMRSLGRTLTGDLDWITLKAMEKDPNRRYATPHALAEDIQRHLRHEPTTAGAPSLTYRFGKFARRNRIAIIAAVCIAMLILLGLLSVILYRRNVADRRRLTEERQASALQQADAALATAEVRYAEGDYDQALAHVEASLAQVPDRVNANLLKAHILADTGKTSDAFAMLKQLEAEYPNEGAVYEMLAMLYVAQGDEALVTEYRRLAEAFPPRTPEAFIIKALTAENLKDMLNLLSKALELDWQHYQARRMQALTYAALKDHNNMERAAYLMSSMQPQNPSGYALQSVALRCLGQSSEAIRKHDRAIELAGDTHPDLATFYDQRRETYFRLGHYEQALADANECVRRHPKDMRYRVGLFGALIGLGRYDEADRQYELIDPETMSGYACWLSAHIAEKKDSGQGLTLPDDENKGLTASLLRGIDRRLEELRAKAQRLVSHAAAADFSPDGRKLVYARFNQDVMWEAQTVLTQAEQPGSKGIEIIDDLETGTVRSLVSYGHYPRWSPDGRHIAFVKTAYFFRLPRAEHIHTVPAAGGDPSYLCPGVLLGWSSDSKFIYYYHPQEAFVYKRPFDDPNATPERIICSPTYFPAISPDESCIAYQHRGQLIIKDLSTLETVATWRLPILPLYYHASWRVPPRPDFEPIPIEWSPTGQELSLGSEWADFGLWIYDLRTQRAVRVLRGAVLSARWSSDGKRMAIVTGNPGWEVWQAKIDPNHPTAESLGPGLARQAHCLQTLVELEDDLAKFSPTLHPWMRARTQAFCCAGLGQPDGTIAGFDQWLQSLPGGPMVPAPTYWQMATSMLEWYRPENGRANGILALAEAVAARAPDAWVGQVFWGMAHYRTGYDERAFMLLQQAETLRNENGGTLHPEQVAITAMILHRLGRVQEAADAFANLRDMFPLKCRHDAFQTLISAEKAYCEAHQPLLTLWDRIEEGNLDEALEGLTEIRATAIGSELPAAIASAEYQLALRLVGRGQGYERRGSYRHALSDLKSAVDAAPGQKAMRHALAQFQYLCSDPNFREEGQAIENATQACIVDNWTHHPYIDTLARACATAGHYVEAAKWQRLLITTLPVDMPAGTRERYEKTIGVYEAGHMYYGQALQPPGLVAHYGFDTAKGRIVEDSSGNQLNATLVGDAQIVNDPIRGTVLGLDGDGDWVDCQDNLRFDVTQENTISIWVHVSGFDTPYQTLIAKADSAWRISRDRDGNTIHFACGEGATPLVRGSHPVDDGRWHHIVATCKGPVLSLYMDGQFDHSMSIEGRMSPNQTPLLIGANAERPGREMKGLIDEVRIYNYALDANAVTALHEGRAPARP
jgi:serine/threonine protein kinase/tetratricopeptide (TPR) repeat protein